MGIRVGTRIGKHSWASAPLWMLIMGAPFILAYYIILATVVLLVLWGQGLVWLAKWAGILAVVGAYFAGKGLKHYFVVGVREAKKIGRRTEADEKEQE